MESKVETRGPRETSATVAKKRSHVREPTIDCQSLMIQLNHPEVAAISKIAPSLGTAQCQTQDNQRKRFNTTKDSTQGTAPFWVPSHAMEPNFLLTS